MFVFKPMFMIVFWEKCTNQTDGLAMHLHGFFEEGSRQHLGTFSARKLQNQPRKSARQHAIATQGTRSLLLKALSLTRDLTSQHQLLVHMCIPSQPLRSLDCLRSFPITTSVHAARTIRLINLEREGYHHREEHLSSASEANIKIYYQLIPFRYLRGLIGRQAAVLRTDWNNTKRKGEDKKQKMFSN